MTARDIIMYVRFVTPLRDWVTGAETGFFRAAWYLRQVGCPGWIHKELNQQFNWFNRNLAIPDRVARHFKRRNSIYGVCWFQPEARECIERARYCAWLISEGGVPVEPIKLRGRREVIWHDAHQAVIRPSEAIPRAFGDQTFHERGWVH